MPEEESDNADLATHLRVALFGGPVILYNVLEESRLKAEYWTARAEGRKPYDPHAGA